MASLVADPESAKGKGVPRTLWGSRTVLEFSVLFEGRERSLKQEAFSKLLHAGLKQLYGVIGGAVAFDITSYDEAKASASVELDTQ